MLEGPGLADVRLSWLPSPDDEGGEYDVVGYEVWAGTTYDATGATYALLATLPRGAVSYVHQGGGVGDSSNYFYHLRVVDAGNRTAVAAQQAGKFVRNLSAGANAISVPLEQADWNLTLVLRTVPWTRARTYVNDGGLGEWRSNILGRPYATFTTLNLRMAVWINVSADASWAVAGLVPESTDIPLSEGWNLVGYPSFVPRTVSEVLAGVSYRTMEGFAPVSPYHLTTLATSDLVSPGHGYWVWALQPAVLVIEN